jgi:hypothetical protein
VLAPAGDAGLRLLQRQVDEIGLLGLRFLKLGAPLLEAAGQRQSLPELPIAAANLGRGEHVDILAARKRLQHVPLAG